MTQWRDRYEKRHTCICGCRELVSKVELSQHCGGDAGMLRLVLASDDPTLADARGYLWDSILETRGPVARALAIRLGILRIEPLDPPEPHDPADWWKRA